MALEVHLVVNPAAGAGDSSAFVERLVEPLLRLYDIAFTRHDTESVGDGERIGKAIATANTASRLVLIVAGGDGTTHELIQGIRSVADMRASAIELVILATGTANALYTSICQSAASSHTKSDEWLKAHEIAEGDTKKLFSFCKHLNNEGSARVLPLTIVQPRNADKPPSAPALASHVVVSTALHANLLRTAEELRSTIPGVARFKEAAQRNIGTFHSAKIRFMPSASGQPVRKWNPGRNEHDMVTAGDDGSFSIEGPFSYLLATTVVHSLEPDPAFTIAPLVLRTNMRQDEMDVMVIRPLRDPVVLRAIDPKLQSLSADEWDKLDEEAKARAAAVWPARAMSSIGQAYQAGAHVDLVYATEPGADGSTGAHVKATHGDERESVVEIFRCGAWEWRPTASEIGPAHTVCIDGALQVIPADGSVHVSLPADDVNSEIVVRC